MSASVSDALHLLRYRLNHARRLTIIGVGSELRGDDAAGELTARAIPAVPNRQVLHGGGAPENYTSDIRRFAPDHIVIIDAADLGHEPGALAVIPAEQIATTSFSTHRMPLSMLVEYLAQDLACTVTVVGIQPATLALGAPVTPAVAATAAALAAVMAEFPAEHPPCA